LMYQIGVPRQTKKIFGERYLPCFFALYVVKCCFHMGYARTSTNAPRGPGTAPASTNSFVSGKT
jgi:hypothetical protein